MKFWEEFIKSTFPDMFQYDEASKQPKLTSIQNQHQQIRFACTKRSEAE
jgi:hypothetical protein